MFVSKVSLRNLRNYEQCELALVPGRNILIGENAQGKTNLLEAIELLATARSPRADRDIDLVRFGSEGMSAEVAFVVAGQEQTLRMRLSRAAAKPGQERSTRLEKQCAINGVIQKSPTDLLGRLLVVSFASHDLNLLRGGPKFRRDWLDSLILKLRPTFAESFANYSKSLAQRNRLLKTIFERGKVTVSDQDQLLAWDKQVARFGARIIKERLSLLARLLPMAEAQQQRISRQSEALSIRYLFKAAESSSESAGDDLSMMALDEDQLNGSHSASGTNSEAAPGTAPLTAGQLAAMDEIELAKTLMRLLKERRAEEIRRKQTTVGPHRDDLVLCLNETDATSFASQGQQRSIVLSLKMAEVNLLRQDLNDSPVLLLDDVLAELDEVRQALLMSFVEEGLQTIITTTHVTGFHKKWLDGAAIFQVQDGHVTRMEDAALING